MTTSDDVDHRHKVIGHPITAHLLAVWSDHWLILRNAHTHQWQLPGGIVKPGESPAKAVTRETHEETGLTLSPGRLLVVAWIPPNGAGRRDRLSFVFAGPHLTGKHFTALRPHGAVDASRLVPPEDAFKLLPPLLTERLRAAVVDGTAYMDQVLN